LTFFEIAEIFRFLIFCTHKQWWITK